jgi:hypothetical protein
MTTREETLRRLQDPVNTANKHVVGVRDDEVIVMAPPSRLTAEEALVFAAWLVTMAECVRTWFHGMKDQDYARRVEWCQLVLAWHGKLGLKLLWLPVSDR